MPPPPAPAKTPASVAPAKLPQAPSQPEKSKDTAASTTGSGPGLFGRFLGKIGVLPKNQAHLPDDKENTIIWDEEKKRWVDKNASEDDNSAANSAPPSDLDLSRTNSTANFEQASGPPPNSLMPPMMGGNKFAGGLTKKRGALGKSAHKFKFKEQFDEILRMFFCRSSRRFQKQSVKSSVGI